MLVTLLSHFRNIDTGVNREVQSALGDQLEEKSSSSLTKNQWVAVISVFLLNCNLGCAPSTPPLRGPAGLGGVHDAEGVASSHIHIEHKLKTN